MKRNGIFVLTLLVLALTLLAACNPAGGSEPVAEGAQPVTAVECPEATEETRLFSNAGHGYCLLYPAGHKIEKPSEKETAIVVGGLLNAGDPRVHIMVEAAEGRTAEAVADQLARDFAMPDMSLPRSTIAIGGETAVVLDRMPGQDLNRRVVFTHDGRLYQLMFMPLDGVAGDSGSAIEVFYNTIVSSFTFIPQSDEVVEECLEPKAGEQLWRSEVYGFCLLYPAQFQVEELSPNTARLYTGSGMDGESPNLFIMVEEARGRTATQVADEIMASDAGIGVERSFGLTVGFEVAELLETVAGQELGRRVLVVHNGRLYTLTFFPDGYGMDSGFEEIEELYPLVLNSFRFLPEG